MSPGQNADSQLYVDIVRVSTYDPDMKKKPKAPSSQNNAKEDDRVVLKPILGIAPGAYLTALYGTVVVLILFFLLVFPGIVNYGTQVRFSSNPAGASVLVDGVRIGATPYSLFLKAGQHKIIIRKPYFKTYTGEITVPGRVFFSLFIPARRTSSVSLSLIHPNGLIRHAASSFASWAMIGEAHGQYQFPPVLTNSVRDLYAGDSSAPAVPDKAAYLLDNAVMSVQSPTLLRDYMDALALDLSAGQVVGPLQFEQMLSKFIQYQERSQSFPLWLRSVLSAEAASKLTGSSWYTSFLKSYSESVRVASTSEGTLPVRGPRTLSVDYVPFTAVPGGTFIMGRDEAAQTGTDPLLVPSKVRIESFYIMSTETSRAMYARFLQANPEWRPSNKKALVADGKVTDGYLSGWTNQALPPKGTADLPVTEVSYEAARAFAAWLNTQLPRTLQGYEVRLPTEAEWEYAARLSGIPQQDGVFQDTYPGVSRSPEPVTTGSGGRLGIHDLMGNVWEWTDSWYRPAEPPLARVGVSGDNVAEGIAMSNPAAASLPEAYRTVKGGSFANRSASVSPATRGALPPDWCTPYLGFRVVIVPKA